jgi:Ran GTPase-activating protein (RanGAP) involved in mRNA processing and transport
LFTESSGLHLAWLRALLDSPHLTRLTALAGLNCPSLAGGGLELLLSAALLSRLTELDLQVHRFTDRPLANPDLAPLFSSSALSGLTTLHLRDGEITADEARALGGSPCLGRLATLRLLRVRLPSAVASALALTDGLPSLAILDLVACNELGPSATAVLSEWPRLQQLDTLRLNRNPLRDAGVQALVRSGKPERLRILELNACQIGPKGARALAGSPHLGSLVTLWLRTNKLGDEGAIALAGGKGLPRLASLQLSNNGITSQGVQALAKRPPGQLKSLDLSWNALGAEGVADLAASPALGQLESLDLGYAQLKDDAARALANSPNLARLRVLNLGTNRIGPEGARALARSPHLTRLKALNLGYNEIGTEGVQALVESPLFTRLTALNLAGNRIEPARLVELRRTFRGHLGG